MKQSVKTAFQLALPVIVSTTLAGCSATLPEIKFPTGAYVPTEAEKKERSTHAFLENDKGEVVCVDKKNDFVACGENNDNSEALVAGITMPPVTNLWGAGEAQTCFFDKVVRESNATIGEVSDPAKQCVGPDDFEAAMAETFDNLVKKKKNHEAMIAAQREITSENTVKAAGVATGKAMLEKMLGVSDDSKVQYNEVIKAEYSRKYFKQSQKAEGPK